MPPKRVTDVFDDVTSATVNMNTGPATSTRDSKRKRTQTEKGKNLDNHDVNVEATDEVIPEGKVASSTDDSGADTASRSASDPSVAPTTPERGKRQVGDASDSISSPETDGGVVTRVRTPSSRPSAGGNTTSNSVLALDPVIFDFARMTWFPANMESRIHAMLSYKKDADGIYSLSVFPYRDMTWGKSDSSTNKLCKRDSSVPVVIWIIGHVTSVWFYDQQGNPHNKVSIGVAPLTAHAMNIGRKILSQFARPQQNIESWVTHLSASRWQTMRIPKRRDVAVVPFDRCYDATKCFESKSKMATIPVENIKSHDLVLMEATVGRYSVNNDASASTSLQKAFKDKARVRSNPSEWKPTFDLLSVSLLCAAPDDPGDAGMVEAPDPDVQL